MWIGLGTDVSSFGGGTANAVLPAWRRGPLSHSVLVTPWSEDPDDWGRMLEDRRVMAEEVVPVLEAATPGSGSYANEYDSDLEGGDFRGVFYGDKYGELLGIKRRWDSEGLFWGVNAVGSEGWEVGGDGRLCRVRGGGVLREL